MKKMKRKKNKNKTLQQTPPDIRFFNYLNKHREFLFLLRNDNFYPRKMNEKKNFL